MPAFAGFNSLLDYLNQRMQRESLNQSSFSEALGLRCNYINSIFKKRFVPSRARCDAIARYFGDDPHIVRVLAGHESPPLDLEDQAVREIHDLIKSLNAQKRQVAILFLRQLSSAPD